MQADIQAFRSGFTQLPNILIDAPNLNPKEKLLIWALLSFKWDNPDCWPGRPRLAVMTGMSERALVDVCAGLRDKQVIEYKRRGYGRSNSYRFLDPNIETMIERLLFEPAPNDIETAAPEFPLVAQFDERSEAEGELQPVEIVEQIVTAAELPLVEQIAPAPGEPVEVGGELQTDLQIEPIKEQIEPVSPIGSIHAETAQQCRANSASLMEKKTQQEQYSVKRSIISPAPAQSNQQDDKKDDKSSDPIVQIFEQVTGAKFRPERDTRALARLQQFHFIAVVVGIISTSLNAREPIRSLAYCVPESAQMQRDNAHEQAGYVGYALSKLAPKVCDKLIPVLARLSWPRGWDKEQLALQAAIETQARKQRTPSYVTAALTC